MYKVYRVSFAVQNTHTQQTESKELNGNSLCDMRACASRLNKMLQRWATGYAVPYAGNEKSHFLLNRNFKIKSPNATTEFIFCFLVVKWIYVHSTHIKVQSKPDLYTLNQVMIRSIPNNLFLFLDFYAFFCWHGLALCVCVFEGMLYLRINATEIVYRFFSPYDTIVFIGSIG